MIPFTLMGSRFTYPNIDATFKANVVDVNCSNANVCTLGNLYVDRTILFAKMTPREDVA